MELTEARLISLVSTAIDSAIKPYIKDLVDAAVREIPFTVKKEFMLLTQTQIIDVVREEVRKRIHVIITTKEG